MVLLTTKKCPSSHDILNGNFIEKDGDETCEISKEYVVNILKNGFDSLYFNEKQYACNAFGHIKGVASEEFKFTMAVDIFIKQTFSEC